MKNYFFYTVIILLLIANFSNTLFAQQKNEKYEALNAYFETIIKDTTQTVYVAKEKINSNETLKIFGLNDIMIIDRFGNGKGDTKLYNKKDFEKMEKKYKNKCISGKLIWCSDNYWSKEDFRYKKVVLESMNTIKGIEPIMDKYNDLGIKVYSLSDPIYYQNKKHIVFTVHRSYLAGASIVIIIMKKIKGKWIVTYKAQNPNEIN